MRNVVSGSRANIAASICKAGHLERDAINRRLYSSVNIIHTVLTANSQCLTAVFFNRFLPLVGMTGN